MNGYTTSDVTRLVGLPASRIRAYARAGFVRPARGQRNEYLFTFADLVVLRTAAELERARVPARRISAALASLHGQLPEGGSLTELSIAAAGGDVVVRATGAPPWSAASGQFQFEFEVAELAARAAGASAPHPRFARAAAAVDVPAADGRTAGEWFELALELEPTAPDEARAAYEQCLALEPGLVDARVNLGRLLQEQGEPALAEEQYRAVLTTGEHGLAAYNLAVLLEDQDRITDAMRMYGRAIAADPSLAEAHYNLARLYERRGDQRAAIRHFNGYREIMKGR
jgi:tetratricopeptide (TPR) repeat protein